MLCEKIVNIIDISAILWYNKKKRRFNMLVITKDNFKTEVEEHRGLVVIDLYADWCGPCRMLAPILAKLEEEYPEVKFCKINVDNEPELAKSFNVTSIPMVAFVKNNVFADVSVGLVPKDKLAALIDSNK